MKSTSDTTASAARVQGEILRGFDGPERLAMALRMGDEARAVSLAGIRHRHPDWSETQAHHELLRVMLGPDLAAEVIDSRSDRR